MNSVSLVVRMTHMLLFEGPLALQREGRSAVLREAPCFKSVREELRELFIVLLADFFPAAHHKREAQHRWAFYRCS